MHVAILESRHEKLVAQHSRRCLAPMIMGKMQHMQRMRRQMGGFLTMTALQARLKEGPRPRERERETQTHTHTFLYIYIYIQTNINNQTFTHPNCMCIDIYLYMFLSLSVLGWAGLLHQRIHEKPVLHEVAHLWPRLPGLILEHILAIHETCRSKTRASAKLDRDTCKGGA